MSDAAFYENSWAELLKASRGWQIQYDVQQLLTDVCRTAHDLLGFDQASAFLLENSDLIPRGHWPASSEPMNAATESLMLEVAQSVIHSGRPVFVQRTIDGKPATMLCAPLTASREILGALQLLTTQQSRKISDKDQQFFEMLASQAAASLEHTLLYQSAITDPLTGLFCHRHFRQEVDQAVRRAIRNEEPLSLLLMDLDHFKALNDTCGHEAGNQCLLQVASILRATFRSTDILARFGGDEFEILLLDTNAEDGLKVAEKVREKVEAIPLPQGLKVTATIGLASFPLNAFSAQPLFLRADTALYAAKEGGRNRVLPSSAKPGDRADSDAVSAERAVRLLGTVSPAGETDVPPSALKPGAVEMVDGHIVKRRLGVGSMGEVLLVTQPGLDRDVALKRPLTAHQSFEQSQAFEREAKVTAGLNHPGIVPIFNIGRDQDSRRYYTMKPLDGRTLQQIVDARRKGDMETLHTFTPGRLLEILQRVSETVAYAHMQNVLHLDLTPGNILVGRYGEVTVIDWSTGSHESGRASDSQGVKLVGSTSFIAPEMVRGKDKIGPACDVFALGTLLYYLLTDALPFQRASTSESVDALLTGSFTPPDALKPESGIDSQLSALSGEALAIDPAQRPNAERFAERLGKFLRGETDWTTTRFGPDAHPLREDEWAAQFGSWRIEGDNWVSQESNEGILKWKVPVPGSFRFSCEAWAELPNSELSIIGHCQPATVPGVNRYWGYFFQVGAEYNTVFKIARHDNDVVVKAGMTIEPGRRYRIEIEYQDADGLLHCAINGKRVLTFRELFPFSGAHLGFYSFTARTHFKPLEVQSQNWSKQIPAMRAADRNYSAGHFGTALDCYREIAAQSPDGAQGAEAQLKAGMCLAEMNRDEEAFETLQKTKGTIFEPFALAERAIYEMRAKNETSLERTLNTFRDLFQRFPESQARVRIFDAARQFSWVSATPNTRTHALESIMAINRLGAEHIRPPAQSQLSCASRTVNYLCWLGRWNEALDFLLDFRGKLFEQQMAIHQVTAPLIPLALATNRMEHFPDSISREGTVGLNDCHSGVALHYLVHKNLIGEWLARPEDWTQNIKMGRAILELARRNLDGAKRQTALSLKATDIAFSENCWRHGYALADSGQEELFELFVARFGMLKENDGHIQVFRALRALISGDFERAAGFLTDVHKPEDFIVAQTRLHLQMLLASLGLLKRPSLAENRALLEQYFFGASRDLALMFCGEREPVPGELWPSPRWHPEWRWFLALWLEGKGRRREAHALAAPCRNPAYGWTHSQPGIEALLKRTE